MGFSLSWVAVEASAEKTLFTQLGLGTTGESSDDGPEFELSGARLSGWYLLVADHTDALVDEQLLKTLSGSGRVIAAMVEEHVMFSSAEEWRNGERVWAVEHNAQVDIMHLATEGTMPDAFARIQSEQLAEQEKDGGRNAGVDHVFDVPIRLAEEFVGYSHSSSGMEVFHELRASRPVERSHPRAIGKPAKTEASRPGLFSRLFGRS